MLVCGLNIRDQNRITVEEQRHAFSAVANELDARFVGDKGSYLVTSQYDARRVVDLILGALQGYRPDLKIPGVAVESPAAVTGALAELVRILASQYSGDFDAEHNSVRLGEDVWRAGLALPLFPMELPRARFASHRTKNAMIFGWMPGGILVAKREAKNVHWGTTVTDPARRLLQRQESIRMELTARSANVVRDLVA